MLLLNLLFISPTLEIVNHAKFCCPWARAQLVLPLFVIMAWRVLSRSTGCVCNLQNRSKFCCNDTDMRLVFVSVLPMCWPKWMPKPIYQFNSFLMICLGYQPPPCLWSLLIQMANSKQLLHSCQLSAYLKRCVFSLPSLL